MPGLLDPALHPEARWNTHAACLQRIAEAAARGLDLIDVAGLTGIAFRTSLCAQATPSSLYLTCAWEPQFRLWFSALGLDADVTAHSTTSPAFEPWLARQPERAAACLERGFPVLYWDNVAFGLILGLDGETAQVTGVPRFAVHPYWLEHPGSRAWAARTIAADEPGVQLAAVPFAALAPTVDHDMLLAYPQGVTPFPPERAAELSLVRAYAELAGQVEYPRRRDSLDLVYQPQFGAEALTRLRRELAEGAVHHFGLVQFLQALTEARIWAWQYMLRLPARLDPRYAERASELAQFFAQAVDYLRPLGGIFRLPLDEKTQLRRRNLDEAAEALYQVQQAELTALRLLAGLARELASGG